VGAPSCVQQKAQYEDDHIIYEDIEEEDMAMVKHIYRITENRQCKA
jgi:hypothetical protein